MTRKEIPEGLVEGKECGRVGCLCAARRNQSSRLSPESMRARASGSDKWGPRIPRHSASLSHQVCLIISSAHILHILHILPSCSPTPVVAMWSNLLERSTCPTKFSIFYSHFTVLKARFQQGSTIRSPSRRLAILKRVGRESQV